MNKKTTRVYVSSADEMQNDRTEFTAHGIEIALKYEIPILLLLFLFLTGTAVFGKTTP